VIAPGVKLAEQPDSRPAARPAKRTLRMGKREHIGIDLVPISEA